MKIIGISGTDGSGKDSLGEMLAQDYGWLFISVTDLLRAELKKRGLPVTRPNQRMVSAEWRKQHGLGVLLDKAIAQYEPVKSKYAGLVVASLRNPGEADRLHELKGTLVWIDADPQVRYQRVINRQRGGVEDSVTYEEFLAEEAAQMSHKGDITALSQGDVKKKADIFIENNSNNLETFRAATQKALGL